LLAIGTEKDVHRTDRHIPLFEGEDIPHPDPDSPFAEVGTNVHLEQMKDMLLTYNEYNRGLGYVQGMSDLLAPIYAVEQDDAVAFWGFVGFMDRMVSPICHVFDCFNLQCMNRRGWQPPQVAMRTLEGYDCRGVFCTLQHLHPHSGCTFR